MIVALQWLKTLPNIADICHARNGGEVVVNGDGGKKYMVDGMDETRRVYEFYGCFYHGCRQCHPNHRHAIHSRLGGESLERKCEVTQEREQAIRRQRYRVVKMWQCQFKPEKTEPIEAPLEPRQAFFGGRTNVIKVYHKAVLAEGEEIRYVDFTSLYPWVNKNGKYPVGHPEIIFQPETTNIACYFGLARVSILPPRGLYHPVLPYRCGGKLVFPLCASCAEENLKKVVTQRTWVCEHSVEQRVLVGTWCTPELEEAVARGYCIQKIHEVWHFANSSTALFAGYINTFLKLKQEGSGWPAWVGNDAEKRVQYVQDYLEKEGVQLEADKIAKNPGRRWLAKQMLNSFWGKYGQQSNKAQVKVCKKASELYPLLSDTSKDIRMVRVVTEKMVEVVYQHVSEADPVQPNINIFVAAFTTCYARLKLYREGIAALQPSQVLYFDTDSIIYCHRPDQPELPLGDNLGELTNELDDPNNIIEFASAGPKNYGYVTRAGKVECKV